MTEYDRIRKERALACDMHSLESLKDAIRGLQSTDDPELVPLHDRLMVRYEHLKARRNKRMRDSEVKVGMRVVVTRLESTSGMSIAPLHMACRREGAIGVVRGHVPGHGGDVWFVDHDGSGEVGAYCFTEIEPYRPEQPMKTLESLRREGEAILRKQEEDRQQMHAGDDQRRRDSWRDLVEAARADLGEMVAALDPETPDETFSARGQGYDHTLHFLVYGVPCQADFIQRAEGWQRKSSANGWRESRSIKVPTGFEQRWVDDKDTRDGKGYWTVAATDYGYCETDSPALAVATAHQYAEQYRELCEDARARPAPAPVAPRKNPRLTAAENLRDALRTFLRAYGGDE